MTEKKNEEEREERKTKSKVDHPMNGLQDRKFGDTRHKTVNIKILTSPKKMFLTFF